MARQYIIRTLLADLAEHPDRPQTAAQIAKRTKNDEAKVRVSLAKWIDMHPDSPAKREGVGIYRWVSATNMRNHAIEITENTDNGLVKVEGYATPSLVTQGAIDHLSMPSVSVRRGGVTFEDTRNDPTVVCDFVIIKRTKDVVILQDTEDESLWIARRA